MKLLRMWPLIAFLLLGVALIIAWFLPLHVLTGQVVLMFMCGTLVFVCVVKFGHDILKIGSSKPDIAVVILYAVIALCAGVKLIADIRTKIDDPISSITGSLHITFDRVLEDNEIERYQFVNPHEAAFSKGPPNEINASSYLTIASINVYKKQKSVGGHVTTDLVTHITYGLNSEASFRPNNLHQISSKKLGMNFDYLQPQGLMLKVKKDCKFAGVLDLVINGKKTFWRSVPWRIVKPQEMISILAPLNEEAVEALYQYPAYVRDPAFVFKRPGTEL